MRQTAAEVPAMRGSNVSYMLARFQQEWITCQVKAISSITNSFNSARSRRRLESRRRVGLPLLSFPSSNFLFWGICNTNKLQRAYEQSLRKEPGRHRLGCLCHACTIETMGPPCWSCGASRNPPPPRPRHYPGPPGPVIIGRNGYPRPQQPRPRDRERRRGARPPGEPVTPTEDAAPEERMSQEDIRTWSLAYSLSIDVYVCAERYLMQDFKAAISSFVVNRYVITQQSILLILTTY